MLKEVRKLLRVEVATFRRGEFEHSKKQDKMSKPNCETYYNCGKREHFAKDCRQKSTSYGNHLNKADRMV